MSSDKITFLTNWQAVPYHLPVYRAQSQVRILCVPFRLPKRTRDDALFQRLTLFLICSLHIL